MSKIISNLYILAILLIIISFIFPSIMIKNGDEKFGLVVYKETSKPKVEASDIYLVKAIHDISKSNSQIQISSNNNNTIEYSIAKKINPDYTDELNKLKEYDIIENKIDNNVDYSVGIIDKHFQTVDSEYTIHNVTIESINNFKREVCIENKSGKILEIVFSDDELNKSISTKELLLNFIKYLGLDIIDDWKMEDDMLKSESAGLIAVLLKNDENYRLTINSNEIFENFN